jgi:hypothetical protein
MTRAFRIAAALALLLSPMVVHAQSYRTYGSEAFFAVDWQAGDRRGRPVVTGHVVNTYGIPTHNVRLFVQSLDAAGQATATTIGYVSGDVLPGARMYFEVPVERPAPAYRVVVLSWDWKSGQSGLLFTPPSRRGG